MARQDKRTKLGISMKAFVSGLGILLAVFLALAGAAWEILGNQARGRYSYEIDAALQDMTRDVEQRQTDIAALGNWLAAQPALVEMVRSRDNSALEAYLQPWTTTSVADSIAVTDSNGAILACASKGVMTSPVSGILTQVEARNAIGGTAPTGIIADSAGQLQRRVVLPIADPTTKQSIGLLALGFYLDGNLFRDRSSGKEIDMAFIYKGRIALSSMVNAAGKPFQSVPAPSQVADAWPKGLPTDFFALKTDSEEYLFRFRPLRTDDRTIVGYYGAGVSMDVIDNQRSMLLGSYALGFLVACAGMSIVGFLFVRRFATPMRSLTAAFEQMANGDLQARLDTRRDDELGELARHVDRLRRRMKDALESATHRQEHLSAAIAGMGVAVVMTDTSQRIVCANPVAQALLKRTEEELCRLRLPEVFALGDRRDSLVPASWIAQPQTGVVEHGLIVHGRFPLCNQPQTVLDMISTPIHVNGKPEGHVHILQDVSELEHQENVREGFVLSVAHELRGPLASLRAYIDLLIEDHATMTRHDLGVMLRTLQRVTNKFQGLTEDLIDVGNIRTGRFRVLPIPSSIDELLQDAVDQTQALLRAKGQHLEVRLETPNRLVLADRPRIIQVVVNLLTNANKYAPGDSTVTLATRFENGHVHVSVTDRGAGIPPEEQEAVFSRFYRGQRVREDSAGIGVGLALAKGIVEAHGGEIRVTSVPGEETTIDFSLREADFAPITSLPQPLLEREP